MGRHAAHERARGGVLVDEAEALAVQLVVALTLLGIGDEDVPADRLDPERRVVGWDVPIGECAGHAHLAEAAVEHVHAAVVEVRRVKEVAARGGRDRKPLEDGVLAGEVGRHDGVVRRHGRAPAEDLALLGVEDEQGRARRAAHRDREARSRVGDEPRRGAVDVDGWPARGSVCAIDRRDVRLVVGDPPRRRRKRPQAPGVHEERIGVIGDARLVGDEVVHHVGVAGGSSGGRQDDGKHGTDEQAATQAAGSHLRLLH